MDEKTEELRDIFVDVTDEETVTERQSDPKGSLLDGREELGEAVADVVEEMRERFEFETDLGTETLVEVAARYYDGDDDADIARELDVSPAAVRRARVDLHLLDEDEDEDDEAVAEARDRIRRANERFSDRFDELLGDELSERLAETAREDGLEEAAEDIETDVKF